MGHSTGIGDAPTMANATYGGELAAAAAVANGSWALGAPANGSSSVEDELGDMKGVIATLVMLLFSAIVVVGLIGNSLVVVVVSFNQQMRSTTNLLIINLAVADLLFIVFCVPFTATDYILYWPFGDLWCKCVQYLIVVTAYASVYTLVLMSLDRFLAVVHPIASMYVRTEKNANTAIFIIWGVIVIMAVPVLYRYGEVTISSDGGVAHTVCVFLDQVLFEGDQGYNQPIYQVSAWGICDGGLSC